MPIYEYQCKHCENIFEELRSLSDVTLPPCPGCTSKETKKIMSTATIKLKGAGFHKTDYPSIQYASGKKRKGT